MGVFARFMTGLDIEVPDPHTISIDATCLKAHCTASSLRLKKGGRGRLIGRTKGGINTKVHAVNEIVGRPIVFFLTAGQVSDFTEARAPVNSLPTADWLLADRGYDADWFRKTVVDRGITRCIPQRKSRDKPIKDDKQRYKRRKRMEIIFGSLKNWWRIAPQYDRCLKVFLSAIALAATFLFWL